MDTTPVQLIGTSLSSDAPLAVTFALSGMTSAMTNEHAPAYEVIEGKSG